MFAKMKQLHLFATFKNCTLFQLTTMSFKFSIFLASLFMSEIAFLLQTHYPYCSGCNYEFRIFSFVGPWKFENVGGLVGNSSRLIIGLG